MSSSSGLNSGAAQDGRQKKRRKGAGQVSKDGAESSAPNTVLSRGKKPKIKESKSMVIDQEPTQVFFHLKFIYTFSFSNSHVDSFCSLVALVRISVRIGSNS